jgi:all-trans-retinol 13,14-reductase
MTCNRWDAIFVGAGITSLACAALLVKRHPGLRLLLIDKHVVPGGYATTFSRPKPEATFDCSLHKLSGVGEGGNLIRILRELELDRELQLNYPDDYFCAYKAGSALPLANDADRLEQQLRDTFPQQAQAIAVFFGHVRTFGRNGYYQISLNCATPTST